MNGNIMSQDFVDLETKVACELAIYLKEASIGSVLDNEPSTDLLYLLELYIPRLLSYRYPEWEKESLDGFSLSYAKKIELESAELAGLCILISDQTVTPILARLSISSSCDSITSYEVYLGEPGNGRLGISGPPYKSSDAEKLLENVSARFNSIKWVYTITSSGS
jgi:hypothetical protein